MKVVGVGFSVVFFFFQAEDGIRDKLVTGVQTCALPISPAPECGRAKLLSRQHLLRFQVGSSTARFSEKSVRRFASEPADRVATASACRSEERRVGKECRSRWSAYH